MSAVTDQLNKKKENDFFVGKYADDIFIRAFQENDVRGLESLITTTNPELTFTAEEPENVILAFLDLLIHVEQCLCWQYEKEIGKTGVK